MADKKTILCILEILKRHSDANHPLGQNVIVDYLMREYGITADRKTVKANIDCLIDCGYCINYSTKKTRSTPNKRTGEMEDTSMKLGYYLVNDFVDSELRLLIDSVMFSPNIPEKQSKELITKLQGLSSEHFKSRVKHIATMSARKTDNKQLFVIIDLIDEAISTKKKITYKHMFLGTDLEPHIGRAYNVRTKSQGSEIEWKVSPYQMVMNNGKYYLICSDMHKKIRHVKLDEMVEIKILEEAVEPFNSLKDSNGQALNLKEYMREHVLMHTGEAIRAQLRILKPMFGVVTDTFGKDIKVISTEGAYIDIIIKAPRRDIYEFALRNMGSVTVIDPDDLADDIMAEMARAFKRYKWRQLS